MNLAVDFIWKNQEKLGLKDRVFSVSSKDVNLYQKNYIRHSRALVDAGLYAGVKPEGV